MLLRRKFLNVTNSILAVLVFSVLLLFQSCKKEEEPIRVITYVDDEEFEDIFSVTQYTLSQGQTIDVYIPPDYDPNVSHPILYFNDGDNFSSVFNALTNDYPEPFLMVGIHAGNNRNSKYIPYRDEWIEDNWGDYIPNAGNYSKQIIEEIIPYVEERYNANAKRRAIFGMSLGGLHATWIALQYPEYFSFVGALSPSYWVNDYAIIGEKISGLSESNRFYFDIGTGEWNYYVPFINKIKEARLTYGKHIFYYEVEGGTHTSTAWVKRIRIPFLLFLNGGAKGNFDYYHLAVECIPSEQTPGLFFQRLNPTVVFDDGIIYSLTTEAAYEVLDGDGQVTADGRFSVNSGTMKVRVSYLDWAEEVELTKCN